MSSTLVLLSVGSEEAAREGFARILDLHAVALLTLEGCALVGAGTPSASGSSPAGRPLLIDGPPDEVGVRHVDVIPAFAPLLQAVLQGGVGALAGAVSDGARNDSASDAATAGSVADATVSGDAASAAVLDDAAAAAAAAAESTAHPDAIRHANFDDESARQEIAALLARGENVLVFLASTVAEGEVTRQLEFLNAQRVWVTVEDKALERLEGLTPAA